MTELKRVPQEVKRELFQATTRKSDLPHLSEMAEHFVALAGGPRAFAMLLWDEFNSAPPGSLVRQKTFDMITRCWKFGSETLSANSASNMGDEELNQEIDILCDRLLNHDYGQQTAGVEASGREGG